MAAKYKRFSALKVSRLIANEKSGLYPDGTVVRKARFQLASNQSALDSVARHLGMFHDKLNVGGKVTVRVIKP